MRARSGCSVRSAVVDRPGPRRRKNRRPGGRSRRAVPAPPSPAGCGKAREQGRAAKALAACQSGPTGGRADGLRPCARRAPAERRSTRMSAPLTLAVRITKSGVSRAARIAPRIPARTANAVTNQRLEGTSRPSSRRSPGVVRGNGTTTLSVRARGRSLRPARPLPATGLCSPRGGRSLPAADPSRRPPAPARRRTARGRDDAPRRSAPGSPQSSRPPRSR